MALPTFAKKEEIPKGFEEAYEEKDGKWVPKAPDTSKLEETIEKIRAEKKAEEDLRKKAEEARADLQRKIDAAGTVEDKDKLKKLLEKFDADVAAVKTEFEGKLAKAS